MYLEMASSWTTWHLLHFRRIQIVKNRFYLPFFLYVSNRNHLTVHLTSPLLSSVFNFWLVACFIGCLFIVWFLVQIHKCHVNPEKVKICQIKMNKLYISIPSYQTKLLVICAFNTIAVLMMADAPIFFCVRQYRTLSINVWSSLITTTETNFIG